MISTGGGNSDSKGQIPSMLNITCGLQITGGVCTVSVWCGVYVVVKAAGGQDGDIDRGWEF